MTLLDSKTDRDDDTTRPSYYGGPTNPYEPVKVIHDVGAGPGFYLGSALKYIARSDRKGSRTTDLKKAEWYLTNGVRLGYELPKLGDMEPLDVVRAWNLPEALGHVVMLILTQEAEEAGTRLRAYLEDNAPQPDVAPMPFSKG